MNAELSVRELAAYPALGITLAMEGPSLDRPVRWAHSTELLDPRPYLHGGELVLTVGAGLTDPERCIAFVDALAECRVSALGLGIGDVHAQPPAALVEACREAGIPLLLLPPSTPFIEITELLAEHRIRMASNQAHRETTGRLLEAVAHHQASGELLADDITAAGLDPQHLVASVWSRNVEDLLRRRLAYEPHLIGELPGAVVLLAPGIPVTEEAAVSLGVACRRSEVIDISGLTEALEALLAEPDESLEDPRGEALSRRRAHYSYLVNSLPQEALTPLLTELVEPLTAYDSTSGAHLLGTLESFLLHDGSVQAAARSLHLHPNSLRHRLTRIYELTGRNPLLFRDQVDFAIAIEAYHRRQHTQPT